MRRPTPPSPGRPARLRPSRGTVRRLRRTVLLAAMLLAALPAAAEAAPYADTASSAFDRVPRFFIETIAVEGVRQAKPGVIISESLLAEGHSYTETELREAVYRIQRLPFVLDAGFALGKGSERGHYRLLVTVEEVHRFFFGADVLYQDFSDSLSAGTRLGDEATSSLSAGVRFFAGQGVFFAAVADLGDLQLGYERYRLFDSPVFLRLAYSSQETCCSVRLHELGLDPAAGTWTTEDSERAEVTVGLPLGGNHSLRLDANHLETGSATRRPFGYAPGTVFDAEDLEESAIELAWVYDSTDDPVFPTRGDAWTAAVGVKRLEASLADSFGAGPPTTAAQMRSRLVGLSLLGARNWPLSARQTVSLSLKLLLSRSDVDNVPTYDGDGDVRFRSGDVDALEADLGVRYSLALGDGRHARRRGDLRWETVASVLYVETSPVYEPASHPLWGMSASTTLALRNGWGIFRIGFAIFDYDGEL